MPITLPYVDSATALGKGRQTPATRPMKRALRLGGLNFDIISTMACGKRLTVLKLIGDWYASWVTGLKMLMKKK